MFSSFDAFTRPAGLRMDGCITVLMHSAAN